LGVLSQKENVAWAWSWSRPSSIRHPDIKVKHGSIWVFPLLSPSIRMFLLTTRRVVVKLCLVRRCFKQFVVSY
jgi:hypothetical protein